MPTIIDIPPVEREIRIGKAFNALFHVISATESAPLYDEVVWRLNGSTFFHPFFISGLSLYKKNSERAISIKGVHPYTSRYFDLIHFDEPLTLVNSAEVDALMKEYQRRTYIPICRFSTEEATIDAVTSGLQNIMQCQRFLPSQVKSALSYLMGEIVGNIHDHSKSEYGYIYSQFLSKEKCLGLCIADFGITIYGSFLSCGKYVTRDLINEGEVLNMALSSKSTKNRPEAENRGFGLPTTKNMLANGMGGAFFILSGNAFHRHDAIGQQTVILPRQLNWNGTIVLLKIPIEVPEYFNYLKFVEKI